MINKNFNIYDNIPIRFNNIGMFKALHFLGFYPVKTVEKYYAIYEHATHGKLIVFNELETETIQCISPQGKPMVIYDLFAHYCSRVVMNTKTFQDSFDQFFENSSYDYKQNPELEPIKVNKLLNVLFKARRSNEKHPIAQSKQAIFIELSGEKIIPALKTNRAPYIIYFENNFSIKTGFDVPYRFIHGNQLLNRYLICSSIKDFKYYNQEHKENYQLLMLSAESHVKDLPMDKVLFPIYTKIDDQTHINEYYLHKISSLFAVIQSFEPSFSFKLISSFALTQFLFSLSKDHSRSFRTTLAKRIKSMNATISEQLANDTKPSELNVSNQISFQASKNLLSYSNQLESIIIIAESLIETLDLKIISIIKY